jgi:hypothetical protein
MSIVQGAIRALRNTADATTAAAGAVGGAAVNGVVGGVQGTVAGVRNGISSGSHSTPAAALTLAAIGAAGLVEWPVLLTVGGTALLVRQLSHKSDGRTVTGSPAPASRTRSAGAATKSARSAAKAPPRKASARKAPARKAPARKATTSRARSGNR